MPKTLKCAVMIPVLGALGWCPMVTAQPAGGEFQVNTTTADDQWEPDVAMNDEGEFVVVFQNHLPVTNANVGAQRFDANGNPVGAEFQVNTTANSGTTSPAVAMSPDGDFVVAWQDFGDDGSGNGIFAQRYNAAGVAQGGNFGVNTTVDDGQHRADVAMDENGNFVVVWEDVGPNNVKRRIRGQRYDNTGTAQGGEMDISDDANIDHTYPRVAMDRDGEFVVGWAAGDVGANQDVVFRRYDAAGVAQGAAVQVNVSSKVDHASGVHNNMGVAADAEGNFVVVWRAETLGGLSMGILARLYDKDGNARGDAFTVHDSPSSSGAPDVAMEPDGDFIVAFYNPDGSLSGIFARRYNASGQPVGGLFQLNQVEPLIQDRPSIAVSGDGAAAVAWRDTEARDGDQDSVWARLLRYDLVRMVGLPDDNGSGDDEIAVLRPRLNDRRAIVEIRETDGTLVRKNFYRPGLHPKDLVRLANLNGANLELGVLQTRKSDGRTIVEIRDSLTGNTVSNVFFAPGSMAIAAVVLDEFSGNNAQEIGVLGLRDSDGRVIVEVRDAATGALVKKIFYSPGYSPLDLVVVPDMNGNGAQEVAVLMFRLSDGRLRLQVRDGQTGALLTSPFHPPGYSGVALGVVNDLSGNGIVEIASLTVRDLDGRVAVRLQDAMTGATTRLILYLPGSSVMASDGLVVFADNSGNGAEEVGVLLRRDSDGRPLLQIRDGLTGAITRNIWLPTNVAAEVAVSVPTINGGAADEAVVLGFNGNLKSQARVYDSASGAQLVILNFAAP